MNDVILYFLFEISIHNINNFILRLRDEILLIFKKLLCVHFFNIIYICDYYYKKKKNMIGI